MGESGIWGWASTKNPTVGHCISCTQEMITSLKEDLCHGLLLPLLVMVIINNPTLIDSILEVSEFSQRHVGSITSAGRSDKRTCMMIADIPSRGAIGTTRQWMKKPRSLRISREINVPWTRVHTLGSWGWTYVFPENLLRNHFWASLKRWRIVEFCVLPPDSPISAVLQKPVT